MYSKKRKSIIFITAAILGLSSVIIPQIFVPFVFIFISIIFAFYFIRAADREKSVIVFKVFLIGLILRVLVTILLSIISYIKVGHPFFLGADDYGYGLGASSIVAAWKETGYIPASGSLPWMGMSGDLTYSYWLSYLYYFIGEYHLMPLFINCCISAISIILIYLIAREIYDYKVAIGSALLFTFWPSLVLWSTQNLKESLTIFLILSIFLFIIKLQQKIFKIRYWIVLLISILLVFKIRYAIIAILIFSSVISLLFFSNKKILTPLLLIASFAFIANVFHFREILFHYFNRFSLHYFLDSLNQRHHNQIFGAETSYLPKADISNLFNFIIYLPLFLLYILFSPFPWQVYKLKHIFGSLEMWIWVLLIIFAFKGLILTLHYKIKRAAIILIFLGIMLLMSFGEGNVGTLFRHRVLIWPCWFLLISAGLFFQAENKIKPKA